MEKYNILLYAQTVFSEDDQCLIYYGLRVICGGNTTDYPCITQNKAWLQNKVDMLLQADLFAIHLHECIQDIVAEEATV